MAVAGRVAAAAAWCKRRGGSECHVVVAGRVAAAGRKRWASAAAPLCVIFRRIPAVPPARGLIGSGRHCLVASDARERNIVLVTVSLFCDLSMRCLPAFCRSASCSNSDVWRGSSSSGRRRCQHRIYCFRFSDSIHSFDPHFVNYIHIHLIWKQHPPTRLILVPIIFNASILLALRSVNFPLWRALGSGLLVLVCQFHHLAESEQRRLSCCAGILVSISFSMPSTTGWPTFAIATIFSRRGHRCR